MENQSLDVRKRFEVAKLTTDAPDGQEAPEGRFEAIVSAFGVLDSQGDVVDKGAFRESVARFEAGETLPIWWSHDYRNPESIIGEVVELEETDIGLRVVGDLDIEDSTRARTIYRQMKLGRLREFSIGGEIPADGWEIKGEKDGDAVLHITRLDLWEVGPCFKGANPDTELLSVKARVAAPGSELEKAHVTITPSTQQDDSKDADAAPDPAALPEATRAALGLLDTFTTQEGVTQ